MFKPQFAALVAAGTKRQTIRPTPKRMPRVGDLESWRQWTGRPYHSPQKELARVELTTVAYFKLDKTPREIIPSVAGSLLPIEDWNVFAKADGFGSFAEMVEWFDTEHGLPFAGILIQAKDFSRT